MTGHPRRTRRAVRRRRRRRCPRRAARPHAPDRRGKRRVAREEQCLNDLCQAHPSRTLFLPAWREPQSGERLASDALRSGGASPTSSPAMSVTTPWSRSAKGLHETSEFNALDLFECLRDQRRSCLRSGSAGLHDAMLLGARSSARRFRSAAWNTSSQVSQLRLDSGAFRAAARSPRVVAAPVRLGTLRGAARLPEVLVLEQPSHQLRARILQHALHVLAAREDHLRLDADQHRRRFEEFAGPVQSESLDSLDRGEKLRRDLGDRNIEDVDILLADQVQQQVERALETLEFDDEGAFGERGCPVRPVRAGYGHVSRRCRHAARAESAVRRCVRQKPCPGVRVHAFIGGES
jgi:hypothetical protein